MRQLHLTLVLGLVFFLTACAAGLSSQPNRIEPGWVKGDNARYSARVFIIGQGNYKYLNKAKTNAREDIASQFKMELNDKIFPFVKTPRNYVTSTEALLNEIQIIDTWQNPATLNHHVFATLPRKQTDIVLRKKISKLDDMTRKMIENAAIENDKLQKFIYASHALDKQLERFAHQQILNKISPEKNPVPLVWRIPKLNDDLNKLLHRIRIKPYVINDNTRQIEKALIKGLKQSGVTIDKSRSADFVLQARLVLDFTNQKSDNQYDTKGELKIILTDQNRKIRVEHSWPINISAKNPDKTNELIGIQALNIFTTQLRTAFIDNSEKSDK